MTQVSVHVTQLISDAIYQFAGITPSRHPVDPKKSNRALGFPALITGLCQFYGVFVAPAKLTRPPIRRAFFEKYCIPRHAQGQAPQQPVVDAPPLPLEEVPSQRSISDHLWRIELQMHRYMQHMTS